MFDHDVMATAKQHAYLGETMRRVKKQ